MTAAVTPEGHYYYQSGDNEVVVVLEIFLSLISKELGEWIE